MLNLGGSVLGFSSADSSSASKGESVSDTIRTVSCYADILRYETSERRSTDGSLPALLYPGHHAGDGGHQHPDTDTDRPSDDPHWSKEDSTT